MFEQAFKNIDDDLWKEAGCTTELDYTEQTSWLLFLKYLDGLEQDRVVEADLNALRQAARVLQGQGRAARPLERPRHAPGCCRDSPKRASAATSSPRCRRSSTRKRATS